MADIVHQFPIFAPIEKVFDAVSTPVGLNAWWTLEATGEPVEGREYSLFFGPEYDWRAIVSRSIPQTEFELTMTAADNDWLGSTVGFTFAQNDPGTSVLFRHSGWPEANDHFKTSSFCWAMYLRLLKRYVEFGEIVPYDLRLDA